MHALRSNTPQKGRTAAFRTELLFVSPQCLRTAVRLRTGKFTKCCALRDLSASEANGSGAGRRMLLPPSLPCAPAPPMLKTALRVLKCVRSRKKRSTEQRNTIARHMKRIQSAHRSSFGTRKCDSERPLLRISLQSEWV